MAGPPAMELVTAPLVSESEGSVGGVLFVEAASAVNWESPVLGVVVPSVFFLVDWFPVSAHPASSRAIRRGTGLRNCFMEG